MRSKCDTNRAGHLTLDAYASRPVAWYNTVIKKHKFLMISQQSMHHLILGQ